ncbi:hypothetical protein SKAU_G00391630 [Synaphobranchus kaupii]|uniref:Uncharacterized protein n=1 Tax=Synaphobranchus kaupii TaxID=118154 RepID=A0A9Q1IDP6_SYNKA|nr:hypothetical protein SKAU_G00391630 [Synaphobranchus kaupii]
MTPDSQGDGQFPGVQRGHGHHAASLHAARSRRCNAPQNETALSKTDPEPATPSASTPRLSPSVGVNETPASIRGRKKVRCVINYTSGIETGG